MAPENKADEPKKGTRTWTTSDKKLIEGHTADRQWQKHKSRRWTRNEWRKTSQPEQNDSTSTTTRKPLWKREKEMMNLRQQNMTRKRRHGMESTRIEIGRETRGKDWRSNKNRRSAQILSSSPVPSLFLRQVKCNNERTRRTRNESKGNVIFSAWSLHESSLLSMHFPSKMNTCVHSLNMPLLNLPILSQQFLSSSLSQDLKDYNF